MALTGHSKGIPRTIQVHFFSTQTLEGQMGTRELRILEHLRHLDNLKALGHSFIQALGHFGTRALDHVGIQKTIGHTGKQVLRHLVTQSTSFNKLVEHKYNGHISFYVSRTEDTVAYITTRVTNRILKFKNRDTCHFMFFREYYNFFS